MKIDRVTEGFSPEHGRILFIYDDQGGACLQRTGIRSGGDRPLSQMEELIVALAEKIFEMQNPPPTGAG